MLSDSSSVSMNPLTEDKVSGGPPKEPTAGTKPIKIENPSVPTNLLSHLLLYHSGVYDFTGSRPPRPGDRGELSFYYQDGGVFTKAFFDAAVYGDDTNDGWNGLLQETSRRIPQEEVFEVGGIRQRGQHPYAFRTQ